MKNIKKIKDKTHDLILKLKKSKIRFLELFKSKTLLFWNKIKDFPFNLVKPFGIPYETLLSDSKSASNGEIIQRSKTNNKKIGKNDLSIFGNKKSDSPPFYENPPSYKEVLTLSRKEEARSAVNQLIETFYENETSLKKAIQINHFRGKKLERSSSTDFLVYGKY